VTKETGPLSDLLKESANLHLELIMARCEKSGFKLPDDWPRGIKVLDLACGSNESERLEFQAWFARQCSERGAEVLGIDIKPQDPNDKRIYTHYTADIISLIEREELNSFVRDSCPSSEKRIFDLIYSRLFLCQYPSIDVLRRLGMSTTEAFFPETNKEKSLKIFSKITALSEKLKEQAKPLLKENGLLALEEDLFILKSDKLIPIPALP